MPLSPVPSRSWHKEELGPINWGLPFNEINAGSHDKHVWGQTRGWHLAALMCWLSAVRRAASSPHKGVVKWCDLMHRQWTSAVPKNRSCSILKVPCMRDPNTPWPSRYRGRSTESFPLQLLMGRKERQFSLRTTLVMARSPQLGEQWRFCGPLQ